MPTPGRPTLYDPDFADTAHNYCLLGATNADLAAFFDVAPRTIDNWLATHADFAAAVRQGRAAADARVARCLYDKAVGYDRTVERTVLHQGREHTLTNTVRVEPDTRACMFWLRNRQPAAWSGGPRGGGLDDGAGAGDAAEGDASRPGPSAPVAIVHRFRTAAVRRPDPVPLDAAGERGPGEGGEGG